MALIASCSHAAYLAAECHVSFPVAVYAWPGDSFNIPLGGDTNPGGTEETLVQHVCASVITNSTSLEDLILHVIAVVLNIALKLPFCSH
jgi:hypothetical protein